MVMVPGAGWEVCGVNVTLIVQLWPAARDVPQVFVCVKKVKEETTELIPNADVPMFVTVIVCGALEVPRGTLLNAKLVVDSLTEVAATVTDRVTVLVTSPRFPSTVNV